MKPFFCEYRDGRVAEPGRHRHDPALEEFRRSH